MELDRIILKLREADTSFNNRIGGAIDLATAMAMSLKEKMAFVVPLNDTVTSNAHDVSIVQTITESFGIVVCIPNDSSDKDKTGFKAYNNVHDIRTELFSAILGWAVNSDVEGLVEYGGGRILSMNRAQIWYEFDFNYKIRIDDDDGVDVGTESLDDFNTLYAQWKLAPSDDLPATHVPISAFDIDMTTQIDLVETTTNTDILIYTSGTQESTVWNNIANAFDGDSTTYAACDATKAFTLDFISSESNDNKLIGTGNNNTITSGIITDIKFGVIAAGLRNAYGFTHAIRPMPGGIDSWYGKLDYMYELTIADKMELTTCWTDSVPASCVGLSTWTWSAINSLDLKYIRAWRDVGITRLAQIMIKVTYEV